jgi:cytochrome c oxidase subunit 2
VRPPPRTWRLVATGVAVGCAGLLSGCDLPGFGAPDPASKEGKSIWTLWQGFFIAALCVGALVWGLLVFVVLRYRRRNDDVPGQNAYHIPLEILYTALPVVAVAVLFGFSVATERNVTSLDDKPAVKIEVIGFQWSWEFHYQGTGVVIHGTPDAPPEMVLPVDKPVHLRLVSNDVAHSFWVPDFLSKRDLIPRVHNEIQITPTKTGVYDGRCAEYCGLDHWRMSYSVRVVSEADYESWLAKRKAATTSTTTSTSTTTRPHATTPASTTTTTSSASATTAAQQ